MNKTVLKLPGTVRESYDYVLIDLPPLGSVIDAAVVAAKCDGAILVISDDLDLPLGRLRLRAGGADGGHNGLKSIIAELGSASFKRLRVGIGRPKPGETVDYVLSKFEGGDAETFEAVLAASADAVRAVLTGGMSRAMNKFNAWAPPEKSETNQ